MAPICDSWLSYPIFQGTSLVAPCWHHSYARTEVHSRKEAVPHASQPYRMKTSIPNKHDMTYHGISSLMSLFSFFGRSDNKNDNSASFSYFGGRFFRPCKIMSHLPSFLAFPHAPPSLPPGHGGRKVHQVSRHDQGTALHGTGLEWDTGDRCLSLPGQ